MFFCGFLGLDINSSDNSKLNKIVDHYDVLTFEFTGLRAFSRRSGEMMG